MGIHQSINQSHGVRGPPTDQQQRPLIVLLPVLRQARPAPPTHGEKHSHIGDVLIRIYKDGLQPTGLHEDMWPCQYQHTDWTFAGRQASHERRQVEGGGMRIYKSSTGTPTYEGQAPCEAPRRQGKRRPRLHMSPSASPPPTSTPPPQPPTHTRTQLDMRHRH